MGLEILIKEKMKEIQKQYRQGTRNERIKSKIRIEELDSQINRIRKELKLDKYLSR